MAFNQFPQKGGIPSGNTAGRPTNPVIGDTYYNGQTGILEIFNGTTFLPCSAPPAPPTVAVTDVGGNLAFGSAQGNVTITPGTDGAVANTFLVSSSTGGYTVSTSGTTATISVGNAGSYTFSGKGINFFGESASGPTTTVTLTSVPQAPTIGTATTSGATTSVTVTWTLNSDGGKNLSAITITPYLDGTTAQTSSTAATTASTSATITGLTQGSSYTFKVKTTNANGVSLESSATNSVTVPTIISVDFLVVAGGGGGGGVIGSSMYSNGGGGAGGFRTSYGNASGGGASLESALGITPGANFTVTVGSGAAATSQVQGGNSVFSNITSTGGGGATGGNGGSGAGTGSFVNDAGTGLTGQGYAGGTPQYHNAGGGGGGAASIGSGGESNGVGGAGGTGITSDFTGSSVGYAGGGGGGGANAGGSATQGGGAGATGTNGTATAGSAGTGGGGGGKVGNTNTGNTTAQGAGGGAGVVSIRYPSSRSASVGAGLTSTTNTSGNIKITTFNSGTGTVSIN